MACLCGGLARLDARRVRFHDFPADHGADLQGFRRAAGRCAGGVHRHAVAAPAGRDRLRVACRSGWAENPVDDLDPRLFAVQLRRRVLADLPVPVRMPGRARYFHGSGMAGRRRAGDGILAGALARFHERHVAGLVGSGLPVVERDLRAALYLVGLARDAVGRHRAGARRRLRPQVRQGAGSLEAEPRKAAQRGQGIPRAAAADLPPEHAAQHADRVPVDGERVRHLLHGVRPVRDASAEGPGLRPRRCRAADRARQRRDVPGELFLGLCRGSDSAGAGR